MFELLGKRYDLPELSAEVVRVHDLLTAMDRSGSRLRVPDA
jgi:hypothetical protein